MTTDKFLATIAIESPSRAVSGGLQECVQPQPISAICRSPGLLCYQLRPCACQDECLREARSGDTSARAYGTTAADGPNWVNHPGKIKKGYGVGCNHISYNKKTSP